MSGLNKTSLDLHKKWLNNEQGGKAYLCRADLRGLTYAKGLTENG